MKSKIGILALVVVALVTVVPVPHEAGADHNVTTLISTEGNGPFDARFAGASVDGKHVFLATLEPLVPADTDTSADIYKRSGSLITRLSFGATGGNGPLPAFFEGASTDGTRVFFETAEALVAADTDSQFDLYERAGNTTRLVSIGPTGGNGPFNPEFSPASRNRPLGGLSADGKTVFFVTEESLVAGDTDSVRDIYERSGGVTTLISTGPLGGNGDFGALFHFASQDGERVIFETSEPLVTGDTDTRADQYERFDEMTTLLSIGPAGGNGDFGGGFEGASADARHVFFETNEPLVASDTDVRFDLYERFAGTTTHVSIGPTGGSGDHGFAFWENSVDGTRAFFSTLESLVPSDTDASYDIYERSGGTTTLLSTGPVGGNGPFDAFSVGAISTDGSTMFFETEEPLVAGDTDTNDDVYKRSGGATELLSQGSSGGNGPFDAFLGFHGASADGRRAFFTTKESLVARDTDESQDVYESFRGITTLLSRGPSGGNGTFDVFLSDTFLQRDGRRVFFETPESLVVADDDSRQDVYAAEIGVTEQRVRTALDAVVILKRQKIVVKGALEPGAPGKKVAVDLQRRAGNKWRTLVSKRWTTLQRKNPRLGSLVDRDDDGVLESRFKTRFKRRSGKDCRVSGRFKGDAKHFPSSGRSKRFAC